MKTLTITPNLTVENIMSFLKDKVKPLNDVPLTDDQVFTPSLNILTLDNLKFNDVFEICVYSFNAKVIVREIENINNSITITI